MSYLLCIVGPTAVGKTALSLKIAAYYQQKNNTPILLSADSRQLYKQMPIVTAQLPLEQRQGFTHFFMGDRSVFGKIANAGDFALEAEAVLENHFVVRQQKLGLLVGGSGLYVNGLLNGFDDFPEIVAEIRQKVIDFYQEKGLQSLATLLQSIDPIYFQKVDQKNPQRMMRAVEVFWGTGKKYSDFLGQKKEKPKKYQIIYLGLEVKKEKLIQNIEKRTSQMFEEGVVEEVAALVDQQHLSVLQTVGFPEIFSYLKGEISLEKCRDLVSLHTKQYAKRQNTWFKKNKNIPWFDPNDWDGILNYLNEKIFI